MSERKTKKRNLSAGYSDICNSISFYLSKRNNLSIIDSGTSSIELR